MLFSDYQRCGNGARRNRSLRATVEGIERSGCADSAGANLLRDAAHGAFRMRPSAAQNFVTYRQTRARGHWIENGGFLTWKEGRKNEKVAYSRRRHRWHDNDKSFAED